MLTWNVRKGWKTREMSNELRFLLTRSFGTASLSSEEEESTHSRRRSAACCPNAHAPCQVGQFENMLMCFQKVGTKKLLPLCLSLVYEAPSCSSNPSQGWIHPLGFFSSLKPFFTPASDIGDVSRQMCASKLPRTANLVLQGRLDIGTEIDTG